MERYDRLSDGIPILKAFVVCSEMGRVKMVKAWCPFCCKWHIHGYSPDITARGRSHRAAHCVNQDSPFLASGYYLRLVSKQEARAFGIPSPPRSRRGSTGG